MSRCHWTSNRFRAVIIVDTNVVTEVMTASLAAAVVSWLNAQGSSVLYRTTGREEAVFCRSNSRPASGPHNKHREEAGRDDAPPRPHCRFLRPALRTRSGREESVAPLRE